MSTELVTVKAAIEDIPVLVPLFDAYRGFYEQPSDVKLAEKFLCERLRAHESVILFCRQRSSKTPLGFAQLYPAFSSVFAKRIWTLNDLFVSPNFRRRGVGRALVEAVHFYARTSGAMSVRLSTAHTNREAQTFYESVGYVQIPYHNFSYAFDGR